jgi:DNA-binding NtrC family response regulator
VLRIHLPPLRERRGDVAPLARRFLAAAGADLGRPGQTLAPDVLELFERYPWPGNVRELKNVVRQLVALSSSPRITRADLPAEFVRAALAAPDPTPVETRLTDDRLEDRFASARYGVRTERHVITSRRHSERTRGIPVSRPSPDRCNIGVSRVRSE